MLPAFVSIGAPIIREREDIMGQYWLTVNLDKREYINPHELGSGLKLREQLGTHPGPGAALIILLAAMPEARGGGDFKANPDVVGRWAGDRIALVGDYAERGDLSPEHTADEIQGKCEKGEFQNITPMVVKVIEDELDGHFEGDGWKDFVYNDGTQSPRAMSPDMILSVKK